MHSQWVVAREGDGYTFKSSRLVGDRFLAPEANAADRVLRGQAGAQRFAVRKVPGTTNLYKCEVS